MVFELLSTERLLLRKLTPEVYTFVFSTYTDNELKTFFGFDTDADLDKEKAKFEKGIRMHNHG